MHSRNQTGNQVDFDRLADFELGPTRQGEYNQSAWRLFRLLFNKLSQAACVGARAGGTVHERRQRGTRYPEESVQDSNP